MHQMLPRLLGLSLLLGMTFLAFPARAGALSVGLTEEDIDTVTELAVFPSAHRSWTAHAVPPTGPLGFSLGVETAFVLRRSLLSLGSGGAVAPNVIPVPRFWGSAELPYNVKLSFGVGLGGTFGGIQTYGAGAQWAFYKDNTKGTSFSVDFRYSYVDVFGDLTSKVMAASAQATKDLILWQPYFGAGFVVGNSTAAAEVLAGGVTAGPHTTATYHVFVGARVDLIAKLSIQLDVTGARPSLGVLLEKDF